MTSILTRAKKNDRNDCEMTFASFLIASNCSLAEIMGAFKRPQQAVENPEAQQGAGLKMVY